MGSITWRSARSAMAAMLLLPGILHAHNPDTCYVRVTLGAEAIEVRFTFDIFTVQRLAVVDVDGNLEVSREEIARAAPAVFEFLRTHVAFDLDLRETDLGDPGPVGWPEEAGDAVPLRDYHQQLVHFPFLKKVRGMPEDFYIGFDVFDALSERLRILGTVINGETQDAIEFSFYEPDYLYDTGHRRPQFHHGWPARISRRLRD